jgi:hypothetical protein
MWLKVHCADDHAADSFPPRRQGCDEPRITMRKKAGCA